MIVMTIFAFFIIGEYTIDTNKFEATLLSLLLLFKNKCMDEVDSFLYPPDNCN